MREIPAELSKEMSGWGVGGGGGTVKGRLATHSCRQDTVCTRQCNPRLLEMCRDKK